MPVDSKQRTTNKPCPDCGAEFEQIDIFAMGGWWPINARCEPCIEKGVAELERREEIAARSARLRNWLEDVGRDAFTDTDPNQIPNPKAYAKAMGWRFGPQGLILFGKSGQGKSRILWALCQRLFVEEKYNVRFLRATTFARAMADDRRPIEGGIDGYLRTLSRVGVLAIDDLGTESVNERWESAFLEVLDRRIVAQLPTLITTNYVGDKLIDRFKNVSTGQAIVRRIRESCQGVAV
jgi:DNA replication protein DnaC